MRFVDEIKKLAQKSQMKFRLAAVVYDGEEIISTGYNRPFVTHRLANKGYCSIHAEVDALRRLTEQRDSEKLSMYVVRIKRDGSFGNSKPCSKCAAEIRMAGIRTVFFTNDAGDFEEMTL